jgi:ABC-type dipeptide/oligopeptide/nickel transport system permease subunit
MINLSDEKSGEKAEELVEPSKATRLSIVWRKLKSSKLAVAGFGIIVFMVTLALFAPVIAPYDPEWTGHSRRPPSMEHLFGTDARGRDMFTLVLYGARTSLYVGLAAVALGMLIALAIGMTSGYFGGIVDEVLMRFTDLILTLPTLPLLLVTVALFEETSIHIIVLVMGLFGWPFMARVVRSEFLALRETTFVEAARSMGATPWRIILRHIMPNILSTIIVIATMDIPWYIFWEATLTFLGFGDPSAASWGVLLERGYVLARSAWWIITFPGLALFFTSLGFNLFGDGLRDALDVTTRGR